MSISATSVSALILAGGQATRLGGVDKRELVIGGRTIFERQVAVLAPRVAELLVSSPRPIAGYRTVVDAAAGIGPLAGIEAGLAAATTDWVLVVAGDMPYLSGALIDLLLEPLATARDAIGLQIGGLPEPLLCVLRRTVALPIVTRRIAAGQRKASRLLTDGDLAVTWVSEAALRALDPELHALRNVNTPADLDR